jgi:hypothetical protein
VCLLYLCQHQKTALPRSHCSPYYMSKWTTPPVTTNIDSSFAFGVFLLQRVYFGRYMLSSCLLVTSTTGLSMG